MDRSTYAALYIAGDLSRSELDSIKAFPDAESVLRTRPDFISPTRYQKLVSKYQGAVQKLDDNSQFITLLDEDYPPSLSEISSAPPVLFFNGDITLLNALPAISVVGSRKADAYGRNTARSFSRRLAEAGLLVVSGLAMGIDSEAHRGAIEAGGKTVAVMGCGVDRAYPASNLKLYHEIAEQGCLLSEFPSGTGPARHHFPRRNRIIAGLSRAVLVIQATIDSGSLITARFAAEYGRDVYAVPGDVIRRNAEGPNWLLKNGAKVVTEIDDVLEEFPEVFSSSKTLDEDLDSVALKILADGPLDFSQLLVSSGLSREELFVELTNLQLVGKVTESGGIWQKC
jgi:DNA processing protein